MTVTKERWDTLTDRYRDLDRPKKMLALDGGGIRGAITTEVLIALEDKLRARQKREEQANFVLARYFDYIAGTSTGAIIAALLAIGKSAREVHAFYEDFGRQIFDRNYLNVWKSLYDEGPLKQKLRETFGDRTLHPRDLMTLLMIVTRNATTDSAWPISSNPDAKYNDPSHRSSNLSFPLWQLVRASTAAPVYFPPEVITVTSQSGVSTPNIFVDGGTTVYNNPAFMLYKMATSPAYRLNWKRGEKNLLLVSIGTGSPPVEAPRANALSNGISALKSLMSQAQFDQDMNCRVVGRCSYGGVLDRELHDLIPLDDKGMVPLDQDQGRNFLYARYDVELTTNALEKLHPSLANIDPASVRELDSVSAIPDLFRIGKALGDKVDAKHFGTFA